jgi:hypothetical protein
VVWYGHRIEALGVQKGRRRPQASRLLCGPRLKRPQGHFRSNLHTGQDMASLAEILRSPSPSPAMRLWYGVCLADPGVGCDKWCGMG